MEELKNIVDEIVRDYGLKILEDPRKFKAVFADYAKGEYSAERDLFTKIIENDTTKEIMKTEDIPTVKKVLVKKLHDKYFLDENALNNYLDILIQLLRNDYTEVKKVKMKKYEEIKVKRETSEKKSSMDQISPTVNKPKKKKKYIFIFFLIGICCLISLILYQIFWENDDSNIFGSDITGSYGNFLWKINNRWPNQIEITGYTGNGGSVIIPEIINGKPVTYIGMNAFSSKNISNIIIPENVTVISSNAFTNNKLTNVNLPNSIRYINNDAFAYNQLSSISIPKNCRLIAPGAFRYNQLTSIIIPSNSVTEILYSAFMNNKLTTISLPDSILDIGGEVFKGNGLTSVDIGANIWIQTDTFDEGDFEKAYNSNNKAGGNYTRANVNSSNWTLTINTNSVKQVGKLGEYEWEIDENGRTGIINYIGEKNKIKIPEEINGNPVVFIGNNAFRGKGLTNVILPSSLINIGNGAFADNSLSNISIPNGVLTIGSSAFSNAFYVNTKIKITIPNSVKLIGPNAFSYIIMSVTIGEGVTIYYDSFGGLGFETTYNNNGRMAGKYTRTKVKSYNIADAIWTKKK